MTTQILVPFEGDGAGGADLTWGQRNIWIPVRRHQTSLGIGGSFPLPAGVTLDDVAAQLRLLVSRHQSLRTRVVFDPGADRGARQVLSASGHIRLEVVDSGLADDGPAKAAEAIRRRYLGTEFDYPNEWPVRWAVVTNRGTPAYLVSMICHLAIDGLGVIAMLRELARQGDDKIGLSAGVEAAASDSAIAGPDRPVVTLEPLEQARWQASAAGQRVSGRALRHWEKLMRGVPARRFNAGADPRQPRHWRVRADSPASYLATLAIAARLQLGTAPVLFAAYAVAFARATGGNPVLTQLLVSNRFRPRLTDSVSPVAQPGLTVIDVANITFDQAVTRAWHATMQASMHSYYDPYEQQQLIETMSEQRGEHMEVRCFLNDRRMQVQPEMTGSLPSASELRAALGRSTLCWDEPTDQSDEPFMASIEDVPDTIVCTVGFDTHYVSPARVETFLREMEAILISAAFDPAAPTGIAPPPED